MSVSALLHGVATRDEHLEVNLCTMLQSVRSTKQYWFGDRASMIRASGLPTLFLTFSCVEYESADIHRCLRKVNDVSQSYNIGKLCYGGPEGHSMRRQTCDGSGIDVTVTAIDATVTEIDATVDESDATVRGRRYRTVDIYRVRIHVTTCFCKALRLRGGNEAVQKTREVTRAAVWRGYDTRNW